MGKTIKKYHYLPILDDRNINDQGIDAEGAAASAGTVTGSVTLPYSAAVSVLESGQPTSQTKYFVAHNATSDALALKEAKAKFVAWVLGNNLSSDESTLGDIDGTSTDADIASAFTALTDGTAGSISADSAGGTGGDYVVDATTYDGTDKGVYGNLYGSSKDMGTITAKLPALSETGGRVNRVGMKRVDLEGSINKFGFFTEYTQESMDFDTDEELMMHLTQEVVKGANEINEDQIQIDLINGAGVIRYAGAATSIGTLQGDDVSSPFASGNTNDQVVYDDLVKLAIELDNNRCPKNTKVITGSRMEDTKVVNAARYIYIGSELQPTIMRMTDYHGNKAFIPVAQYASAGTVAKGEFGAIDNFRFIVVPEMMHKAAAGATLALATGDDPDLEQETSFRYSANADGATFKYNAYPMLVVGDASFTTIGFQTDGKTVKFKTKHVKPENNHSTTDPYGETGFYSIKWYYGLMILRPERIAVLWTLAEW